MTVRGSASRKAARPAANDAFDTGDEFFGRSIWMTRNVPGCIVDSVLHQFACGILVVQVGPAHRREYDHAAFAAASNF